MGGVFFSANESWSLKMRNESDFELANAIAIRIGQLINNTPNRSNEAVLEALMMTIADMISSIGCRGCRTVATKNVKKLLPKFIGYGAFAISQIYWPSYSFRPD
jgi:hypothetical protein